MLLIDLKMQKNITYDMKHLKAFEAVSDTDRERIKKEVEELYIKAFASREGFDEFALDVNNENDLDDVDWEHISYDCLLYTSPSPRDRQKSRMPSSA